MVTEMGVKATPKARELAAETGVDLERLTGTGKHGQITVGDVRSQQAAGGPVEQATARDLQAFGDLADSALAASALSLARELDDHRNSATSKSMCARALIETLDRLRELAPPKKERSQLDELKARRAARRAAATG